MPKIKIILNVIIIIVSLLPSITINELINEKKMSHVCQNFISFDSCDIYVIFLVVFILANYTIYILIGDCSVLF